MMSSRSKNRSAQLRIAALRLRLDELDRHGVAKNATLEILTELTEIVALALREEEK